MPIRQESEIVSERIHGQHPEGLPQTTNDTGISDMDRARNQGGKGVPVANPAAKRAGRSKSTTASKSKAPASKSKAPASKSKAPASKSKAPAKTTKSKS